MYSVLLGMQEIFPAVSEIACLMEVAVVTPHVVEDHRYGCGIRRQSQLEVARVVGSTPVLTSDVTVIAHRIFTEGLVAAMTVCCVLVSFLVFCSHMYWLWVFEHHLDLALFHLQRSQEVFG